MIARINGHICNLIGEATKQYIACNHMGIWDSMSYIPIYDCDEEKNTSCNHQGCFMFGHCGSTSDPNCALRDYDGRKIINYFNNLRYKVEGDDSNEGKTRAGSNSSN